MSEEILKALMQLFAIIAKQDDGATNAHRLFVEGFLKFQLASEKVDEYLTLYDSFVLNKDKEGKSEEAEKKEPKLTSVKDSVRTLGICKKINKTLSQKQKVVVLVRLLEMLKKENQFTTQRLGIIDTVATVFNITKEEQKLIQHLIISDDPYTKELEDLLIVDSHEIPVLVTGLTTRHIFSDGLSGVITIIRIKSVDLFFSKYNGNNTLTINGLDFIKNSIYLFAPGSNIRLPLGTLYYSDVVAQFLSDDNLVDLSFNAKDISYRFKNGRVGLQPISFSEPLGRLVAIMGASGSGKTTLLNVLCGHERPTEGVVEINGMDIHKENKNLKGIIGYISQDDLLMEDLTVYENLYYNAKLCFSGLNSTEIKDRVNKTLSSLGLFEAKDVKVGTPLDKKISGGQRKRLNIALELIREPTLLFVDEPTSGLSSADSENVMDLLKELSIKGKLIFVVIHQPSSDIYKMFDKLILLDIGGYPVYYGNPIEAITYLKKETHQANAEASECHVCGNVNPELLFNLLESKVVDEYGKFQPERKIKPLEWNTRYKKNITINTIQKGEHLPSQLFKIPRRIKQLKVFIQRDLRSKWANTQYIILNTLEAPLLAALMAIVIKYVSNPETGIYLFKENENLPAYIFICVIISLFIGLTVSAEEIFKDRKILKREKFLNLSKLSYLLSKIIILFSITALQTLLFVWIGNSILEVHDMFADYWLVLFSVSCFANILGLNISVSFNSAVTIYILIPILVIPQLIFGGAMFSFDKISYLIGGGSQKSPVIADIFTSRWAFEALMVNQFKENKFEKKFYAIDKKISALNYKQAYYLPKIAEIVNSSKNLVKKKTENDSAKAALEKNLFLIRNALEKECKEIAGLDYQALIAKLNIDSINKKLLKKTEALVDSINEYYIEQYREATAQKEEIDLSMQDTPEKQKSYLQTQNDYTNEYLTDLVRKSTEKNKVKIQKSAFIQNYDPIFLDPKPSHKLDYRAHFFSPKKHFMGKFYTTFSFNLMVIWLMSVVLFLTLYIDFFKRAMELSGRIAAFIIPSKVFATNKKAIMPVQKINK